MGGILGGGGDSTTTSQTQVPEELKPLLASSSARVRSLQKKLPIEGFSRERPRRIAALSPLQNQAIA